MTCEEMSEKLKEAAESALGIPAVLAPQAAGGNTARLELSFLDYAPNGENGGKLVFLAEYATNGTHKKWLSETVRLRARLHALEKSFLPVDAGEAGALRAYWKSLGEGRWSYPSGEESSMPAEFRLTLRVELDIPTNILEE
ncbi:MAG: hypothetical protein IK015_04500 [Treponema sp.]|nr:hypothetical protein [Treponema sp.]